MNDIWLGAAFFAFVMTAVVVVGYLFTQRTTARGAASTATGSRSMFVGLFRSIGETIPASKNDKNPYRLRLSSAGYRWPSALPVFYGIKVGSALFAAGFLGTIALLYRGDASATFVPMICGAGLGFLLPDRVLSSRVHDRVLRLRAAIPPALDLMVLGLEAGQALDQSIADASRGIKRTHPDLSGELAQLYLDLRTAATRTEAFRAFGQRNKEPELRKLSNLLIDSDRFGVSLGPALRTHAKYMRTRFRQHAQESARKVGVKLIFPVFFLIFPSVLLVTLGPACMMMYQQLKTLLA